MAKESTEKIPLVSDYSFQTFSHFRVLTTEEKRLIVVANVGLDAVARKQLGKGSTTRQVVDEEVDAAVDSEKQVRELKNARNELKKTNHIVNLILEVTNLWRIS